MKKRFLCMLAPGIAAVLHIFCQSDTKSPLISPTEIKGNCTGTVRDNAGSIVAGATVTLFPAGYNPFQHNNGLSLPQSTVSDAWGRFGFTIGTTGTYNLLASHEKRLGLRSALHITAELQTESDPVVKEPGSLSGRVILTGETDHRQAVILFSGTGTYALPDDSTGHFSVSSLAEGTYVIRAVSVKAGFAPVETTITITSAVCTEIPDIRLPAMESDIKIDSLMVDYNPLLMTVTLRWHPVKTALLKRYIVYLNREENLNPIAEVNENDTSVTFDITNEPCDTFTYQVTAVVRDGKSGPAVIAPKFVKTSGLTRSRTVPYRKFHHYYHPGVRIDTSGSFYINYEHITGKIDSNGNALGEYEGDFFHGFDEYGNCYFTNYSTDTLMLVRTNTNLHPLDSLVYQTESKADIVDRYVLALWRGYVDIISDSVVDKETNNRMYVINEYKDGFELNRSFSITVPDMLYTDFTSFSFSKKYLGRDDYSFYYDSTYRNFANSRMSDSLEKWVPEGYRLQTGFYLGPQGLVAAGCSLPFSDNQTVDLILLFTNNERMLARIPVRKSVSDFFFDGKGNLFQSIVTREKEYDTIVEFSTAKLLDE